MGTVVKMGSKVQGFSEGDKVVGDGSGEHPLDVWS